MAQIRVLLVAPESLTYSAATYTVDQIASMEGLRVTLVRSPANLRTVGERVREARYDVVCILAHGEVGAIQLDGDVMDATSLLIIVNSSMCEVVVLESCSSVALANEVVKRTTADCLATISVQPAPRARDVLVGFLQALTTGMRPEGAFLRTAAFDVNSVYLRTLQLAG